MKKEHVGMIQFSAQVAGEEAVFIQVYRDGTIVRDGGGGLPPIFAKGQFRATDNQVFRQLLEILPDPILEKPIVWQAPEPAELQIDYKVLCYSQNLNHSIGEQAEWGDMCGLRVVFDLRNPPHHAFVALADKLVNAAKLLTNRPYFDLLVRAATGHQCTALTGKVMINAMDTSPEWLEDALGRYVIQLLQLNPAIKIEDLSKGKFYRGPDGRDYLLWLSLSAGKFSYRFIPA